MIIFLFYQTQINNITYHTILYHFKYHLHHHHHHHHQISLSLLLTCKAIKAQMLTAIAAVFGTIIGLSAQNNASAGYIYIYYYYCLLLLLFY